MLSACTLPGRRERWASGDRTGTVTAHDVHGGDPQPVLQFDAPVSALCELAGGLLAVGLQSGVVSIHAEVGARGGFGGFERKRQYEHPDGTSVLVLAPLPGGGVASGGTGGSVMRLPARAAAPESLVGHSSRIHAMLTLGGGGVLATASRDATVRLWHGAGRIDVLQGHTGPVCALASLSQELLASGAADGAVRLWRGASCIRVLRGHAGVVSALAALPGRLLASADGQGAICLWA